MADEMENGEGAVAFINRSDGGVPKLHVVTARVTVNGIETDRQRDMRFHSGPDRALCLYSLDLIFALQQEGNPIFPGSIGENLTLRGVSWGSMIPGLTLEVGPVRVMITSYTKPCRTIRESFAGHPIARISQKVHPGWSHVYARVLTEGTVSIGDPVILGVGLTASGDAS